VSDKKLKPFNFYIPVELEKSEDDQWKIKGIASTDDSDLQGESIDQSGLDISPLKAGKGLFNWDHHTGPENILGQIEEAEFINHDGKKALQVEGYLFKDQERSKAFHNILKGLKKGTAPRVHMSVEGKVLERAFDDQKNIKRAVISKVALTLDPVNPHTFAELVKSLNAPAVPERQVSDNIEDLVKIDRKELEQLVEVAQKALSAGTPGAKAPTEMSSGESTTKETLEQKKKKDPKSVTYGEKVRKCSKEMVNLVITGLRKAHPEHDPLELTQWVIEAFIDKLN
jgi:hypothetical protein